MQKIDFKKEQNAVVKNKIQWIRKKNVVLKLIKKHKLPRNIRNINTLKP